MKKYPLIGKCLAVGIILVFVGTCIIPAIAKDIEKSSLPTSRGNWLYVGGSGPGNYTRIQDAVDNATDGDTVYVFDDSSPYNESIIVNKQISLIGEDKETTNITRIGKEDLILVEADNVLITGFALDKGVWGYNSDVHVNSVGCTIENNIIHGSYYGVYLTPGDSAVIKNNIITGVNMGITMEGTKRSMISNNIIRTNWSSFGCMAIEMTGTGSGNIIMRNDVTHNFIGISIDGAKQTIIKENNFANNTWYLGYNRYSFFVGYQKNYWDGRTGPIVIEGTIPVYFLWFGLYLLFPITE